MFTNGYGGNVLNKRIVVASNDPARPEVSLSISGKVEPFVSVVPERIRLEGSLDSGVEGSVRIIPRRKYPFTITAANPSSGEFIRAEIQKVAGPAGTEYLLKVRNIRTSPGQYYDTVLVQTDSTIKPKITVGVIGFITE